MRQRERDGGREGGREGGRTGRMNCKERVEGGREREIEIVYLVSRQQKTTASLVSQLHYKGSWPVAMISLGSIGTVEPVYTKT